MVKGKAVAVLLLLAFAQVAIGSQLEALEQAWELDAVDMFELDEPAAPSASSPSAPGVPPLLSAMQARTREVKGAEHQQAVAHLREVEQKEVQELNSVVTAANERIKAARANAAAAQSASRDQFTHNQQSLEQRREYLKGAGRSYEAEKVGSQEMKSRGDEAQKEQAILANERSEESQIKAQIAASIASVKAHHAPEINRARRIANAADPIKEVIAIQNAPLVAKAQHDTAEFKAAMTALRAEGMSVKASHLTHMNEMKHVLEIEKKQDQKQHDMLNTVNKIEHQLEAKAAQVAQQLQAVEKGAAAVASAAAVLPRGLENSKKAR